MFENGTPIGGCPVNEAAPQDGFISEESQTDRYAKQIRFAPLGREGQLQLLRSSALVIGCGALGSVVANTLARAGVGRIRIVDRDFVELDNLQRQVLYTEQDLGQPKAVIACRKLAEINHQITLEPVVTDVDYTNIESLLETSDIVLDGTDNFETRFLINDACVKQKVPWVYGGCLGSEGQTMTIRPGVTACLNCLMLDGPPPPGTTATCDSAGILASIINVIASIQSLEAIKILSGNSDTISRQLQVFDLWSNRHHAIDLTDLRDRVDCPACQQGHFQWLSGDRAGQTAILCGRNAVQLSFPERPSLDLSQLAKRLTHLGDVELSPFLLRFQVDQFTMTLFPDSRAIVHGTEDLAVAKRLYSEYIGA